MGEEPFEDHALAAQDTHSDARRAGGGRPPASEPAAEPQNPPQSCEMALTPPRPER